MSRSEFKHSIIYRKPQCNKIFPEIQSLFFVWNTNMYCAGEQWKRAIVLRKLCYLDAERHCQYDRTNFRVGKTWKCIFPGHGRNPSPVITRHFVQGVFPWLALKTRTGRPGCPKRKKTLMKNQRLCGISWPILLQRAISWRNESQAGYHGMDTSE